MEFLFYLIAACIYCPIISYIDRRLRKRIPDKKWARNAIVFVIAVPIIWIINSAVFHFYPD